MCGFGGFVFGDSREDTSAAKARLERMADAVRHRGPDDSGVWTDGRVGLAHRRLSIIDLSSAGHQPMANREGDLLVILNGEIYNFQALRSELEFLGYRFCSRSDTEVVLHGYHAWGVDVLQRLRGMFAFALWDVRKSQIFLARDRVGKKPLFYTWLQDGLVFASEIKAIRAGFPMQCEPDLNAIHQYISFQYVPAPRTAFQGIRKLPAAHYMLVSVAAGRPAAPVDPTRYWRLPSPSTARRRGSEVELSKELLWHLRESVRLRMISDVPVGAFLSGGVDSSAVVATMAELSSTPIRTFSIGFEHEDYDERRYARSVAKRYGTQHEELVVRPDVTDILPKLVRHYDEPFADPSAIPTWYVSELASRQVKVVLNGDGGDEGFFGYNRYVSMRQLTAIPHLPAPLAHFVANVLGNARIPGRLGVRLEKLARYLREEQPSPAQRYSFTITSFMDYMKREGYGPALEPFLGDSALEILEPYFAEAPTLTSGANWADFHTYLPDNLMTKVDMATMAHGLEGRSPLLDHVFLEWAASLPEDIRMKDGTTKALLKKALESHLPHEILYRKKMGFGCPIDHWLRDRLKDLAYDALLGSTARQRGLFTPQYVERLLREHCEGTNDHQYRLWTLLMLELWFHEFIDKQ